MPITFIPFGELRPDQKLFNNNADGALVKCENVIPIFNHYVAAPVPSPTERVSVGGFSGLVAGRHAHSVGNDEYRLYFGQTGLYYGLMEVNLHTLTVTDRTRASGVYSGSLDSISGWQFASYGTSVFATNFLDDIQILESGTTQFAKSNLTTAPVSAGAGAAAPSDPKARYISSIRNHLLLGHYSVGGVTTPTGVWWAGTDTPRYFGTPGANPWLTNSDKQPLEDDFGHVTGLSSGGDWANIFKERSVVRMDGPPFYFRTVVRNNGCRYPNSIVQVGDDTYYWSEAGPTVLRGGEGPPVFLAASSIIRTLIDNASGFSDLAIQSGLPRTELYGAADVANSLVWWSYRTGGESSRFVTLVYNFSENRFSFIADPSVNGGTRMVITTPDIGDSWRPGRTVAVVNQEFVISDVTEYVAKLFLGGALAPSFATAYYELVQGMASRIVRVRPIYSMNSGSVGLTATVTVNTRDRPYGVTHADTSSAENGQGWITMPKSYSGCFHQFDFRFSTLGGVDPSDAVEFDGFEVEYAEQGRR